MNYKKNWRNNISGGRGLDYVIVIIQSMQYTFIPLNCIIIILYYSVQRENTLILHISSRHPAVATGSPMAGCCVGMHRKTLSVS